MNDRATVFAPEQQAVGHQIDCLRRGARHLSGSALAHALTDARARTWALVNDLTPAQWQPPIQPGVNPIAWEMAHMAWFAEFWVLRGPHQFGPNGLVTAVHPPRFAGPDAHLDSTRLPHLERWTTPMPNADALKTMLDRQLEACVATLTVGEATWPVMAGDARLDEALYFHRLALFHEDMHAEALCWLRDALGYAPPPCVALPICGESRALTVRGGEVRLGSAANSAGFAFDNERPGKHVFLQDFEIDSQPVTALQFAEFVDSGGYGQRSFWPTEAGRWRSQTGNSHPSHWRRGPQGDWQMRWFDQWLALQPGVAAMHLNAFEAEAYCLWAKRRLPTAAEWEHAAQSSQANQTIQSGQTFNAEFNWGNSVWEWTADAFAPYPGFSAGPYRQYSEPWFGDHRELRGGAFATHPRMHHPHYRNFFLPTRSDIFAGFRTASL